MTDSNPLSDFINQVGCILDSKTVIGSTPFNEFLYKVDMLDGKVLFKKAGISFKIVDMQMK